MRIFLDTEFTGLHQHTTLLSLALVADNGCLFYAELTDFDQRQLTYWHHQHVMPSLFLREEGSHTIDNCTFVKGNQATVTQALRWWISAFEEVEVWADVLMYDWVLFCELFGGALQLPKNIFYIPFDFATMLRLRGLDPDSNRRQLAFGSETEEKEFEASLPAPIHQHSALYDAHILRLAYSRLITFA